MHEARFGKVLRVVALVALLFLTCSLSRAFAQAHHEYADPNPQRYQHPPVPEQLPSYEPAPDPQQAMQAQPMQQQLPADGALATTGNQLLDFVHEHLVATFLCILLIAPFWAMFGMRKTKHPYDH
jgi:hypothetical protein